MTVRALNSQIISLFSYREMPAGGGRGKGGGLSFSTESLGFGRGEVLPSSVLSPPPTFPPLNNKPVKLETENDFLLTKSTELRNYFRS